MKLLFRQRHHEVAESKFIVEDVSQDFTRVFAQAHARLNTTDNPSGKWRGGRRGHLMDHCCRMNRIVWGAIDSQIGIIRGGSKQSVSLAQPQVRMGWGFHLPIKTWGPVFLRQTLVCIASHRKTCACTGASWYRPVFTRLCSWPTSILSPIGCFDSGPHLIFLPAIYFTFFPMSAGSSIPPTFIPSVHLGQPVQSK